MKKLIAILLSVLMLVSACAFAEETTDDRFAANVVGTIIEITEESSLVLTDADGMLYEALIDENTDLLDAESYAVGDVVTVWYNGMLTRSIPAQLTATKVSCFALTGAVSEVTEEGFTLTAADETVVIVSLPEGAASCPIVEGQTVTVYYNGMMTRSYPGQITAIKVRCIDLTGEITAVNEDGSIVIADEVKGEVIVHVSEESAVYAELTVGAVVRVATNGIMTMSLPAQVFAVEVLPAE